MVYRFDFKFLNGGIVPLFLLGLLFFFPFTGCTPSEVQSVTSLSEEEFLNPATEYRPLALWTWLNGYMDTTKLVYELEQMKSKDMRGALIWDLGALMDRENLIPSGPSLLGDQSLSYFSLALSTSKKLDLDLGWVAASSWNAGGGMGGRRTCGEGAIKLQPICGWAISAKDFHSKTPKAKRATPYSLIASKTIPYAEDKVIGYRQSSPVSLDEFTVDETFINWSVPPGKWEVFSFFMSNTGQPLVVPSPNSSGLIIDHLSKEATTTYFDSIFNLLPSISSPDQQFKFFMHDSYEVWEANDWSPLFLKKFKSAYEYDPEPYLPLIQSHTSKDDQLTKRFLNDYSKLISNMIIENHFAQSVEIAEKKGKEMIIEAGHGGNVRVDPLKALGNSHIPMGEFWIRQRHWVTKEASSAAHIYGKKLWLLSRLPDGITGSTALRILSSSLILPFAKASIKLSSTPFPIIQP